MANTFLWDFGDGGTSTEEDPSHTYSRAGNYLVTLTIREDNNEFVAEVTKTIAVLPNNVINGYTNRCFSLGLSRNKGR